MEEFTSSTASCSGVASPASTISRTAPLWSRITRPYSRGSRGRKERTVAAARSRRCVSSSWLRSSGLSAGASPERTTRSPSTPSSEPRAAASASPVPRASACTATSTPSNASFPSGEVTTTSGFASIARAVSTTQSTMRRPRSEWKCFGVAERIRVPRPPASTTAAGFGEVIRKDVLGRQDSNLGSRDQNPLPYHLATPQSRGPSGLQSDITSKSVSGRAGKAGPASSGRRRKRRLSTWLRPKVLDASGLQSSAAPTFSSLAAAGEEHHQRDQCEGADCDQRERPDENDQHGHEGDERLRDGRNPADLAHRGGAYPVARPEVEADDHRRNEERDRSRDDMDDDED